MKIQKLFLIFFTSMLLCVVAEANKPPYSCESTDPSTKSYPFCKLTLPINQRVDDLISRLTLHEKISQLVDTAPAIPRLGIPGFEWWSEALHGVAFIKGVALRQGIHFNGTIQSATSFPQVILTAASFDTLLWYRIGQVVGTEARAIYNAGQATGMTFWAPNINIFRDPRWGRGQETPGEDPLVTGRYAVAFVRGVQGDTFNGGKLGEQLKASACCKHFTSYDLDHWKGIDRFAFDAHVTSQDLADTYQPPFKSCIQEGKASGIMCAYNRINGVPSCANYDLLTKTARGDWGFDGYITSDCDAVSIMHEVQGYAKTPEDAVADSLKAGMDLNCGDYLLNYTKTAVKKKMVPESEIDRALHNLFSIRMRLGLFNGNPTEQLYGDIGPDQVCSEEHQHLALEAARDGIVLLKNTENLLPLSKSKSMSLAVIGPNANNTETLVGNYAGPPCNRVTPFQGLLSYVKNTEYHQGCSAVNCSSASIHHVVKMARKVDQVVLVMGLDLSQEREDHDRDHLVLPGKQKRLITSVAKAAKKPIILVLICGGPVDISFAKNHGNIGSILWAGYPGEAGGTALAEIIFGDHNPGGRLPVTWYPRKFAKIPMTDMRMRSEPSTGYPGRTYRFYRGRKVFEFGYGLSYSSYSYGFVSNFENKILHLNQSTASLMVEKSESIHYKAVSDVGTEFCDQSKFSVSIAVKNHGPMPGKHPVLLFVRKVNPGKGSPIKQLVGFQSLKLNPGQIAKAEFLLSPCEHLSRANDDGVMIMEEGTHLLIVGDQEYPITLLV